MRKHILSFLLIIMISGVGFAQILILSKQTSTYKYIYRISNSEARIIHKVGLERSGIDLKHRMPVDSTCLDGCIANWTLQAGNYLEFKANKGKEEYQYLFEMNCRVVLFQDGKKVKARVVDLDNRIVADAKVAIGGRNVSFDQESQCFDLGKIRRYKLLEVTSSGVSNFFIVQKDVGRYRPKPSYYKYFKSWYWQSLFDFESEPKRNTFAGYMVFSKPKYRPNDTLKFKAFIVDKKGLPYDRPVNIEIPTYQLKKKFKVKGIKPYRPGAFTFNIPLSDTLELKLDKTYSIEFTSADGEEDLLTSSFYYEDYELNSLSLNVRTSGEEHYRNTPMSLWIKGTNDNGMNLQDARIKVTVMPQQVSKVFAKQLLVKDTIWTHSIDLEPTGETHIEIPDTLFRYLNLEYNVKFELTTSDNEVLNDTKRLSFYWERNRIATSFAGDSLEVKLLRNGKEAPSYASATAYDKDGNILKKDSISLPARIKINPFAKEYEFRSDDVEKEESVKIDETTSGVEVLSQRTADSVFVRLLNPNHLTVSYTIYTGASKLAEGFVDTLMFSRKLDADASCLVFVQYLWGGEVVKRSYPLALNTRRLYMNLEAPKMIVPGQEVTMTLTAKDYANRAISNADVTLFGITEKFKGYSPSIFLFNNKKAAKYPNLATKLTIPEFDNFVVNKDEDYDDRFYAWCRLDYSYWNPRLQLDSTEFYKFLYPSNLMYEQDIDLKDNTTELAPFVVRNGQQKKIHVIYVDEVPVYYSWTTLSSPYSFKVRDGHHTIKLRTSDRLITVKDIYFKYGFKKVLSLNDSLSYPNVEVRTMPNEFTKQEKQLLTKYLFPYRDISNAPFAYLRQDNNIILLKGGERSSSKNLVGPVGAQQVVLSIPEGYTSDAFSPEPDFEYEFFPRLIKMRSVAGENLLPKTLSKNSDAYPFKDVALTEKQVLEMDSIYRAKCRRAQYNPYPYSTPNGYGRIELKLPTTEMEGSKLVNVIVYSLANVFETRVYSGKSNRIEMLPTNAMYRVNLLYANKSMYIFDSLTVGAFASLYLKVPKGDSIHPTRESLALSAMIDTLLYIKNKDRGVVAGQVNAYNPAFKSYDGSGITIDGYVIDPSDKQPIPGVTIVGTGTNIGTVTDITGHYRIKIPYNVKSLTFRFIGYQEKVVDVSETDELGRVEMVANVQRIEEVVVVGYGVKKRSLSAATSVVISEERGYLDDSALSGSVAGIQIRGASSLQADNTPLYIVDGEVSNLYVSPDMIEKMEVLRGDQKMVSLYGSRAANGVIIITTKKNKGIGFDADFMAQAMQSSGIRSRFADDAFWLPALKTDAKGKVSFKVKFPDDITAWKAFAMGVSDTQRLTGLATAKVNSLKPMSASLSIPRFMVEGDTAKGIGKVLNYTQDTLKVSIEYWVNGISKLKNSKVVSNSSIDSLQVVASSLDSLKLRYQFSMENGYVDGEERSLNIVRKGLEKSMGIFRPLASGDSTSIRFDPAMGKVKLIVDAVPLSLIKEKAQWLIDYRYECNEQLASKLKGWLAMREIKQLQGQKFRGDAEINRILRKLKKSVNPDGLWGWWNGCSTSWEMSTHIVEAVMLAKQVGYNVSIDFSKAQDSIIYRLPQMKRYERLQALELLSLIGAKVDYAAALDTLRKPALTVNELVQVGSILKNASLQVKFETLSRYKATTLRGNYYLRDTVHRYLFFNDQLLTNIRALKLYGADTTTRTDARKSLGYLLEYISDRSYLNTYEVSNFLMAAIPVLKADQIRNLQAKVYVSGDTSFTISKFPFELKDLAAKGLVVKNGGDAEAYINASQSTFVENPEVVDSLFDVNTIFKDSKGNATTRLTGGEKVTMEVTVDAKKMAKYVMLRIPIPAGCTYASKELNLWGEASREYFEDCVCIYIDRMMAGKHLFTVSLLPRFDGTYTLNPAKVEPMYLPTQMGNNSSRKIHIGR